MVEIEVFYNDEAQAKGKDDGYGAYDWPPVVGWYWWPLGTVGEGYPHGPFDTKEEATANAYEAYPR
jgi:hypothetical protein